MADHYFLSYSRIDAAKDALWLADTLAEGQPRFPVWVDKQELRPGEDWDEQIVEAIRSCRGLLFVMTTDSVKPNSICQREWARALKYKKPVIPLRFHREAKLPFRLGSHQYLDFTGSSVAAALDRLRDYLAWMDTPSGALQALKQRLADAERELQRPIEVSERARIEQEIKELRRQIDGQEHVLADPQAARQDTQQRIASNLEREREPEQPVLMRRAKFVNPPPMTAPTWFQGRHVETGVVADFLRDDSKRLLTVAGRGGVGKTAMVVRLLKALEGGQLPDDQGSLAVDGIVYLSPTGAHRVSFPNLFADLTRLLPEEIVQRLDQLSHDPEQSTREIMLALLEAFPSRRIVVLLDSFEDVVDPQTLEVADPELDEALRTLLTAPGHGVKLILTTRIAPRSLLLVQPALQLRLNLDEGLESSYADNLLRAMDPGGTLGLRDAPDALLAEAWQRTRGNPRALEALVAILAIDRDTSLPELLAETGSLPGDVVHELVGEAFSRLDPLAQQVMQALAIYGLPVPPVAVDFLLQPYRPAIDSAPVLGRLVNMQFVRRDAGRHYLHVVDRDYALSRIPEGEPVDGDAIEPPSTRYGLRHRGIRYFEQTRTPGESWRTLEDVGPQLAEFELRCLSGDYDAAATVLLSIEDHLFSWGHLSLLAGLHERLQGRLRDPELRRASLARLQRARPPLRLQDGQPADQGGLGLQQTLRGHEGPITRLAWLPDGRRLLSASLDGSLRLWDTLDGEQLGVFRGHRDRVLAVAVAPDGTQAISASADRTLRLWDLQTGEELRVFTGHRDIVTGVAIALDQRTVVSGSWDRTLRVWELQTGKEQRILRGHSDRINAVTLTPDGRTAISAAWDQTLRVWDVDTGEETQILHSKSGGDNDVVVLDGGQVVASGAEDASTRVWRLSDGRQLTILQGPTAYVTGVSVSADGRVLAAKSADHSVRFWRTDTWEPIGVLDERSPSNSVFAGIAFSPQGDLLATLGEQDTVIRIWEVDVQQLLACAVSDAAVQYTTAKVVLVGDQGVGKTGLGLRLAQGEYRPTDSTHGQHFWIIKALQLTRPNQTDCDVILWDFAGQQHYRLVHALFLEDVDLALLLFDPAKDQPFEAVQYWLGQLRSHDQPTPTVLVAGRVDVGTPRLASEQLQQWCAEAGVSGGYVATSAKTNEGVEDLKALISSQIRWSDKSPTVSPTVFTQIKQAVLGLRDELAAGDHHTGLPRLLSPEQLSGLLTDAGLDGGTAFTFDELIKAVGHLANHGVVSLLETSSGGRVILLVPDILNNLAASIVMEARGNSFGMLDEARLARGDYRLPELADFNDEQQAILLDAAIVLFLKHNLCFRETVAGVTRLIFPSLINRERPAHPDVPTVEDVSYVVTGRVETVYPSLAVQLGHTGTFSRSDVWKNQAQFEMEPGQVCGLRQVESHEGATEFVLYYATATFSDTRTLFRLLFERYLNEQDVQVSKFRPVICPQCGYQQDRNAVMRRVREGKTRIGCANACGAVVELVALADEPPPSPAVQQQANQQQQRAQMKKAFEMALVSLKRALPEQPNGHKPSCFISYAWGDPEDTRWVLELANDLSNAGVDVLLDQWDNAEPGQSIPRFVTRISSCDYVMAVGTPLYRKKAENKTSEAGFVAAAEVDMINTKLTGTEAQKETVLPILRKGTPEASFPELLWRRVYVDFRTDEGYFTALLDVIIKLHRLSFRDLSTVRESLREDLARTGALSVASS